MKDGSGAKIHITEAALRCLPDITQKFYHFRMQRANIILRPPPQVQNVSYGPAYYIEVMISRPFCMLRQRNFTKTELRIYGQRRT